MNTELFKEISELDTEKIETSFAEIDKMDTLSILNLINKEDQLVALAVKEVIPIIELVVEKCIECFRKGGRLLYFGAGTSGRLGILDAAECPPTFGTELNMVQGHIAGGKEAVFVAVEGAEDNILDGIDKIKELEVGSKDLVCGISASGRTPWVLSALKQAKLQGAFTFLITTNSNRDYVELGIDVVICPNVGPEVVAGSTRMKSGTAQKMILNMITTTSMVRLGKTYKNIMLDLQPKNNKLKERAKKVLMTITGIDKHNAEKVLAETKYNVRLARDKILNSNK
ncbi:MAG: N-acetylmuramic acid 6-phosphate etherase [Bacteroidetes bacterium]|nr:N-acetylmuramic acid 6-phosphate etherase [Bacteroidota bacterium]